MAAWCSDAGRRGGPRPQHWAALHVGGRPRLHLLNGVVGQPEARQLVSLRPSSRCVVLANPHGETSRSHLEGLRHGHRAHREDFSEDGCPVPGLVAC